jgi:hypothetical protein
VVIREEILQKPAGLLLFFLCACGLESQFVSSVFLCRVVAVSYFPSMFPHSARFHLSDRAPSLPEAGGGGKSAGLEGYATRVPGKAQRSRDSGN